MSKRISIKRIGIALLVLFSFIFVDTIAHAGSGDYTEIAAKSSRSRMVGARSLGGESIILLLGSQQIPVHTVSSNVFGGGGSSESVHLYMKSDDFPGEDPSKQIYDFFAGRQAAISGIVYLLDQKGEVRESREFTGAFIKAVTFPALGDGSTEHFFTIEFGGGQIVQGRRECA